MSVEQKIKDGAYAPQIPYPTGKANREARLAYISVQQRLVQEFRADLEAEFGLADHPKAALLFDMAWDNGHSSGFQDVYYHYDRLSALVLP